MPAASWLRSNWRPTWPAAAQRSPERSLKEPAVATPHRARKRFGQHFLHDPAVIARIVQAIAPQSGEVLAEIGPGQGALTGQLLAAAGALDAVEIDRDLAALLRQRYAAEPGFRMHEADALTFDWRWLARERGAPLRVVGNLPYNISTPLLFRLLDAADAVRDMHFMLQREVVDRIVATPGTGAYGRLTVMLAARTTAERVLDVGAGAFRPVPKVASSVVRLVIRATTDEWARSELYARIVGAAFNQRRKTLRNSLRSYLTATQIEASGIDPGARAQELSPAQFGALAQAAATV